MAPPVDGVDTDESTPQDQGGMQQAGQIVNNAMAPPTPAPAQPPMGSNGGFFRTLLGTLMQGAMSGMQVQPGPGSFQRGAAAAAANPKANLQLGKEQDEQKASAKQMQELQLAQTQLNMLHTYHMMANEDKQAQTTSYNDVRDYVKQKDDQGQYEWQGQTDNRADAVKMAQQLRQELTAKGDTDGANSVQVIPRPDSSYDHQQWGVARSLGDPLKIGIKATIKGVPEKGLPDTTVSLDKGTPNADVHYFSALKDATASASASRMVNPANPTGAITQESLVGELNSAHLRVPANMGNIWQVYTGQGTAKELLQDKAGPKELNREQALNFIHTFDPQFSPEIADHVAEESKSLDKLSNDFAADGGKNALQATLTAQRIQNDPKIPQAVKARAAALQKAAQPVADQYHQEQIAKGDEKADHVLVNEVDKAQHGLQTAMDKDGQKVTDLQDSINMLAKGGGEGDAIASIAALRGLVGGGGVRITGAELDAIAKARGWSGSLSVMLNNLTNPDQYKKLSDTQRGQLTQILKEGYNVIKKRDDFHHEAYDAITNANSVSEIRKAQTKLANQMRIPALGAPYKFPDGTTRLITADKVDRAKALKGVPVNQ